MSNGVKFEGQGNVRAYIQHEEKRKTVLPKAKMGGCPSVSYFQENKRGVSRSLRIRELGHRRHRTIVVMG